MSEVSLQPICQKLTCPTGCPSRDGTSGVQWRRSCCDGGQRVRQGEVCGLYRRNTGHLSMVCVSGVVMFLFKPPCVCLPGDVLWSQNYGSPVVGVYLYSGDSLRHAPHLSLAMETLRFLTFSSASEQADTHSTLKWSYQFVKEQATAQTQLV